MSFYRKEPACKTYWLLEERRDDTALSPEMPLRSPPLFAHMLTKDRGNESSFQPVVVRMGDDEAFSFQVSVKRTSRKVKSTQEWGWDRVIETEEFFVTNLGPGTILCGGRPLAPQASGSGNRVELMSAKRPLDMRHVTVGDVQCNASCGERISCDGLNKGSECGQNALPQMAFLVVSDEEGDPKQGANYRFYTGKLPSKPDGAYVREFHEEWFGDYQRLEEEHGFIQWLFPLFLNSGVNWEASRLGRGEARLIRRDLVAAKNVVDSYRLMLDFYGLKLADVRTGRVEYADNECVRRRQLENLNYSSHNYLRISKQKKKKRCSL